MTPRACSGRDALAIFVGLALVLVYLAPFLWLGQDSALRVQDTMDGRLSRLVSFALNGAFRGIDTVNPALMGGLVDNSIGNRFNFTLLSFLALPPYAAFMVNAIVAHASALIGMFLLLRRTVLRDERVLALGCALCFGVLPYMPLYCLSVAGVPLLAWAVLVLRDRSRDLRAWAVVALFPFGSALVVSGYFIIPALAGLTLWDARAGRDWRPAARVLAVFCVSSALAEHSLLLQVFVQRDFVSHRAEWRLTYGALAGAEVFADGFRNFVYQQSQALTLHTPLILVLLVSGVAHVLGRKDAGAWRWPAACLPLVAGGAWLVARPEARFGLSYVQDVVDALKVIGVYRFVWLHPVLDLVVYRLWYALAVALMTLAIVLLVLPGRGRPATTSRAVGGAVVFLALAAWLQSALRLDSIAAWREQFGVLKSFQFDRIYMLSPLVWYLLFGLALKQLTRAWALRLLAVLLLCGQGWYILLNSDDANNMWLVNATALRDRFQGREPDPSVLTYRRFYSEPLFADIASRIGRPRHSYRVVSVGMYPSVALHNGYFTLDGYVNNYDLAYKHRFRRIIARELEKSQQWREYFDYWGHRCYVFSAEMERRWFYPPGPGTRIDRLDIDTRVLRSMGGEYVFSAHDIGNAAEIGLEPVGVFSRPESPWIVRVYRVGTPPAQGAP